MRFNWRALLQSESWKRISRLVIWACWSGIGRTGRFCLRSQGGQVGGVAEPGDCPATGAHATSGFHKAILEGPEFRLLRYKIDEASPPHLSLNHGIRDWHLSIVGGHQTLTIEFIKPVDASYDLTLYSEEPVNEPAKNADLNPPQPLDTDRESGSILPHGAGKQGVRESGNSARSQRWPQRSATCCGVPWADSDRSSCNRSLKLMVSR